VEYILKDFPQILGVFSLKKREQIGTGQTIVKTAQVTYWYARRLDSDVFEVQPLNSHHVPSGLRTILSEVEFLSQYDPEPAYYKTHTVPALGTLYRKIREGEELFSRGNLDKAEREFVKALMIDDLNVEANYGLGEVYSDTQEFVKLKSVLDTLLMIDEAFEFKHRARFNKFGMSLRRNGHYDESIRYYRKALEFNKQDDHVYFNLARVYLDKKEMKSCVKSLRVALQINPRFEEARKFLRWCERQPSAS
jgi:tetratricopeptide (TPR) repeat protein